MIIAGIPLFNEFTVYEYQAGLHVLSTNHTVYYSCGDFKKACTNHQVSKCVDEIKTESPSYLTFW